MMSFLANFHFLRPEWLLSIPVSLGVWWFWMRRHDPLRGWRSQIEPELLKSLVVGKPSARVWGNGWLLAAWILAAIAIAGPTWRLEPNPFAEDAQPLMVVLKASESMQGTDPAPSRMERAHLKIADLARLRQGQPLGLLAYAGSAHLVLPPTTDTEAVAQMAGQIAPDIMPKAGDRLDLAIKQAAQLLQQEGSGGTLLVIADSAEIDPRQVAAAHAQAGSPPVQVLVLTSPESTDSQSLEAVASAMGASVQRLTVDSEDVETAVHFAEQRATGGISGESNRWQEAGYWLSPLLAIAVALAFRRQTPAVKEPT